MEPNFKLVIRSGPIAGEIFPLEKGEVFIGRDLNCDIVINDAEVSRRHSRLFLQGANYVIEDLGSTNGTSVNGTRLNSPHMLRQGEVITLGEHVTILFESATTDQSATVVSPASNQPDTVHAASGGPAPLSRQEFEVSTPPKKSSPMPMIIVVVLVLVVICACAVGIYLIDANNMWCSLLPFLFPGCTG